MSEGINNDGKWKSTWQNSLNKCFDEGEFILKIIGWVKLIIKM